MESPLRLPMCEHVNNSNLTSYLTPFPRYGELLVHFCTRQGVPLFNALVGREPPQFGIKRLQTSLYHMMQTESLFHIWTVLCGQDC